MDKQETRILENLLNKYGLIALLNELSIICGRNADTKWHVANRIIAKISLVLAKEYPEFKKP